MRRHFFAPEVVQTSQMDCGPASLKSVLGGWGINVSYDRLRETCHTDIDGTSVDVLEENARAFGLDAEQVMLPTDHLFEPGADALPAMVLLRQPQGSLHMVVVWREHGRFVQVMDPARGRRWMSKRALFSDLYVHVMPMQNASFEAWIRSNAFHNVQLTRLRKLGANNARANQLVEHFGDSDGWLGLAALDAAIRLCLALLTSKALRPGRAAIALAYELATRARDADEPNDVIPDFYWVGCRLPDDDDQVQVRGAVLLAVRAPTQIDEDTELAKAEATDGAERPLRQLVKLLRGENRWLLGGLVTALIVAAAGAVLEALMFRGLLDIGAQFGLWSQRAGAMAAVIALLFVLAILEVPRSIVAAGLGRRLEARLRVAILSKIPRLGDPYFRSRPASDLAERCHQVHQIRQLPQVAQQLIQAAFTLTVTLAGLIWIAPHSWLVILMAAIATIGVPLLFGTAISERDLRVRTHGGALVRYYLDVLLGLVSVRAHGAERSVRREHEGLLTEWLRANRALARTSAIAEALQAAVVYGFVAYLIIDFALSSRGSPGTLLLAYWALSLPTIGQQIVGLIRRYPGVRNTALRLLEPLAAPVEHDRFGSATAASAAKPPTDAVAIKFDNVSVSVASHDILAGLHLQLKAGEHIGVVGPSGAGKSTFAGLLLGWHRASTGTVFVDGDPMDADRLAELRRQTAWVSPELSLWNRSLLDNLNYGVVDGGGLPMPDVIERADLGNLLSQLDEGFQTMLGEGGRLVSGGEGQRVRLGRALRRPPPRLVILDEAFCGLDRIQRTRLLALVRELWADATLICITHDVSDTLTMPRVLVVENGLVIEDADPNELAARPSRYRDLLRMQEAVRAKLWENSAWRTLTVEEGRAVKS